MTLEYLREYRPYFHIGQSWGLNESNVYRTITKVEKILIESKLFRLAGKKALLNQELDWEVVVDVTETPRSRPKKTKKVLQWQEKEAYIKISNSSRAKNAR